MHSLHPLAWALLLFSIHINAVPTTLQLPSLVNTTIHSTNPRIVLSPESSCSGTPIGQGCGRRYDPWDLETYKDENGQLKTYHRTSSWGNQPHGDQIRTVSFGFLGTSLRIYGAPPKQLRTLHQLPGRLELCIQGSCHKINTQQLYDSISEANQHLPVLIWSSEFGNQYHRIQLRLLDTSNGREPTHAMTFHHLVYQESPPTLRPTYTPSSQEELVPSTYYDTNPWISYSPQTTWKREVLTLPASINETVIHSSSKGNDPSGKNICAISFAFRGVALEVYGASKTQMEQITGGNGYEHAHQEICIDNVCHAIDTHQLYLNIRHRNTSDPVLLWSYDHFPTAALRYVQLRLLDKDSPVGHIRHMTFNRFVVTEIRRKSLWTHPILGAYYTHTRVGSTNLNSMKYLPSQDCAHGDCKHTYAPWENKTYIVPGGQELIYYHASTQDHERETHQRSLQISFTGYNIKLYGAPRPYLVHAVHAKQEICLGAICQPIDAERAYLHIEPEAEHHPVLLWSMEDIDVSGPHTLIMRMTESGEEAGDVIKGMTFSHVEYTKVEIPGLKIGYWLAVIVLVITGVILLFRFRSIFTFPSNNYQPLPQNVVPPPPAPPAARHNPPSLPQDTGYGSVAPPPNSTSAAPPPIPARASASLLRTLSAAPPPAPAAAPQHEPRQACNHRRYEGRRDGACTNTRTRVRNPGITTVPSNTVS
ncbi:hypothetical protein FRB94_013828 [Tulasnella sp. JGI-2019a]|nr:hypothetical protein FRB94_013828 [Tulasnella sp. JGI-2019a]KAG8990293.1 hypothetical protein FRB93_003269 [Tulasnella sp. JGI-2019a]